MHRSVRLARLPRVLAVRSAACGLLATLPATARAQLPAQLTSVVGGSGGTTFTRDCGGGRVLTGLRGREGLQIDAIAIMCAPVLSNGTLGPTSAVGTLAGGGGGTFKEVRCDNGFVVYDFAVNYGALLNDVFVWCKRWDPATRKFGGDASGAGELGATRTGDQYMNVFCSTRTQPGSGIRGRSGVLVDAIGLVCDEP